MTKCKLLQKTNTKFHVLYGEDIVGSISVEPNQIDDLLKQLERTSRRSPQAGIAKSNGNSHDEIEACSDDQGGGPSWVLMTNGVSAMVRAALWLEDQLGVEILSIGRGGLDRSECTLEASGSHLVYEIVLDGGYVFLRVQLLDSCDAPESLMSIGDCKDGWRTICRLIGGFERNNIRSLEKPIELGSGGPNSWVIG